MWLSPEYPTLDDGSGEKLYDLEYMKHKYGHHATWDSIVCCVTGILREPKRAGHRYMVYIRLNDWGQQKNVCMPLKVARVRLPQKLIVFYEKHLQWHVHEGGEPSED
ncbi:hypothetical protein AAF712_005641 [Marasmius tenuissimus]|uniref:Chromo shadow domain-containing protein n=1 Tax=Marasmius tenuissimus TaxID=585030 RepID=A0ABR3A0C7_9AGAR|nr:hypothetical protein PM082_002428 [Marasmius tenuissimus]KAJ8091295.1 hypothetical protein PM082_024564 [Marasmius tenuissimus]